MNGIRLREARLRAGHTQESLGELIESDARQIWRWESGETQPKADIVAKLAVVLGVSSDYLLGLTDDPSPAGRELTAKEAAVIAAWRRGERFEAMKVIANDE